MKEREGEGRREERVRIGEGREENIEKESIKREV